MANGNDFSMLFFIAKKTRVFGKYSGSTVKIARETGLSQQSVSRKLIGLEKKGLIERHTTASGITVSLKRPAVEMLSSYYNEMKRLFSGEKNHAHSINGTVISGLGEGKYYLSQQQYAEQIRQKFGFNPYPGTLNMKVDASAAESFLNSIAPIYVRGFETKERNFGGLNAYRVKINKTLDAALIVPDRTSHSNDVVEIIAAPFLRKKLGLKDGSAINVSGVIE